VKSSAARDPSGVTIRFPTFARARDVARASDAGDDGTTRSGKISRARMRRAARASDRTRVVEAVETPIPRMCLANADDDDAETTTRRRAMDGSIDDARTARRDDFDRVELRARVFDSVSVARCVASTLCSTDVASLKFQKSSTNEIRRARRHTPPRADVPAHSRLRRLRRVSRVSRARENDDERRTP
jgi:hypothetical protein